MKIKIAFVLLSLALFSCNSKQQEKTNTKKEIAQESNETNKTEKTAETTQYQISVYDDPKFADRILEDKKSLKQLSEKQLFSKVNAKMTEQLDEKQNQFFKTNADYELLSFAKGSLFQTNSEDYVFVVYDIKSNKVKFLLFNGTTNTYAELFKDIKVENGLDNCGSYSFGTLDYQFAQENLIMNEGAIEVNPGYYLEESPVKITDISKDETFLLKDGCFSKKASKTSLENTLCISTSPVYNNWDCLKYNKTNNTFLIFYSQAFAD